MYRAAAVIVLLLGGCATTDGVPFPTEQVDQIRIGETSRERVREMFGDPWQVGIEDGLAAWSYLYCRQPSTGRAEARDLSPAPSRGPGKPSRRSDSDVVKKTQMQTTFGDRPGAR
jgi:outer membrane protein assembly factor BamE (lipoprotein component of BamABCDE complex)